MQQSTYHEISYSEVHEHSVDPGAGRPAPPEDDGEHSKVGDRGEHEHDRVEDK